MSRFVRGVFIIPGHGNVVGLGQALSQEATPGDSGTARSNEQGMAQAAVAFAKQMKRKQICVATSAVGPGAANMVTACGTATANNIPWCCPATCTPAASRLRAPAGGADQQPLHLHQRRLQGRLPLLGPHRPAGAADERHDLIACSGADDRLPTPGVSDAIRPQDGGRVATIPSFQAPGVWSAVPPPGRSGRRGGGHQEGQAAHSGPLRGGVRYL